MSTNQLLLVSSVGLAVNLFGMFAMGGHHHHVCKLVLTVIAFLLDSRAATPIRMVTLTLMPTIMLDTVTDHPQLLLGRTPTQSLFRLPLLLGMGTRTHIRSRSR